MFSTIFKTGFQAKRRHASGRDKSHLLCSQGSCCVVNIGLVVNARGKLCLVHDEPFGATPLWVAYHIDKKQLELLFDSGSTYPIEWEATDVMHQHLLTGNKILIIRMENKKPIEGYDTNFIRLQGGKAIH